MDAAAAPARRIGVVGIGLMGWPIAQRLHALGHSVAVRDIDPARAALAQAHGIETRASAQALARDRELLIVVVVDAGQTREVLFGAQGAAPALPAGAGVMLCPTIGPADVEALAARLAGLGLDCIEAPMSGGPARARAGTMSLMLACAAPVFARWQALLQQIAAPLFHLGPRPGDGARTKLVNNLLAAVNLAGAAEAMRLAEELGLDPAATLDVIEQSSGQSWIGSDRIRRVLAGDSTPRAHMGLLAKDSALALQAAAALGLDLPLGQVAAQRFDRACQDGQARADDSALWLRRRR